MKLVIHQPGKDAVVIEAHDDTRIITNDQRKTIGKYQVRLEPPSIMQGWPEDTDEALNAVYGTPDPVRGYAPEQTYITPPYPMFLAWQPSTELRRMKIHKKVAPSLLKILEKIESHYTPAEIRTHGLDMFGGTTNVRMMRNGNRLSRHSWGIAIDIDPLRNGLLTPLVQSYLWRYCPEVFTFFEEEGWSAGGRLWSRDAMHFMAVKQPEDYAH